MNRFLWQVGNEIPEEIVIIRTVRSAVPVIPDEGIDGVPSVRMRVPVTWLNTIWLNFLVESFGLKSLGQVTTKLIQLHSNSRNKYVNSRKYHNLGNMRCMHARPHRRKEQLPLRSLRDLRSR